MFDPKKFKRSLFCLSILVITSLVCGAQSSFKRRAPKEVTPIVINNIRYTAPVDQMGYIVAKNAITDSVLWRKQVYTIHYDNSEKDVQDIFIDSLYVKGKNLMAHTERGKVYLIPIMQ